MALPQPTLLDGARVGREAQPGRKPSAISTQKTPRTPGTWSRPKRAASRSSGTSANDLPAAFWGSDLSPAVKEAALFNISTLRSQTFFRDEEGHPLGWEGCLDDAGSCLGSCTHVWNYDLATGFLFASLARQMREIEYLHATAPDGAMSFRVLLPLDKAQDYGVAADGKFGCVLKLFREWRLSGDDQWLKRLWPACRRSVEFAWIKGGWDADRDGLAEGAQHNTMDVEYFGPNPEVQSWYLGALAAAEQMAKAVVDDEFASTCRDVLRTGAAATEAELLMGAITSKRSFLQVIFPASPRVEAHQHGRRGRYEPGVPGRGRLCHRPAGRRHVG